MTTTLGQFTGEVCPHFNTYETPTELHARCRWDATAAGKASTISASQKPEHTGHKRKAFNMATYKMHALGHYVKNIQLFGSTDSYSTQIVRMQAL
jgi:hypothetical protein